MEPRPIEPDKDSLVSRIRSAVFDKMDKIKDAISYGIRKYNLDGSSSMQLAYSGADEAAIYQSMELATEITNEKYGMGIFNACNQCSCHGCDNCHTSCNYD